MDKVSTELFVAVNARPHNLHDSPLLLSFVNRSDLYESGNDTRSKMDNLSGFSFNCEDHFPIHIFIRSSK